MFRLYIGNILRANIICFWKVVERCMLRVFYTAAPTGHDEKLSRKKTWHSKMTEILPTVLCILYYNTLLRLERQSKYNNIYNIYIYIMYYTTTFVGSSMPFTIVNRNRYKYLLCYGTRNRWENRPCTFFFSFYFSGKLLRLNRNGWTGLR